ncbi:unnamed protein product [Adineta steineri]|uniref:G-protein coupled receptors family 1 profile domain-containing protein n=1 Tax=Adineta steineri TaxID=433720 RepID=A0A814W8A3_9BILA|nr:unnamed protein product [Adineta steineri]CAF1237894.1 unnamed protein product [Adineta steineri]CAF3516456.1 unnamed protein product [Adineta steineri]CAF3979314.1 unnamed protein product [Adineta steineri]
MDVPDNISILTTSTSNTTIDSPNLSSVEFSYPFQFWFVLSFEIPSVICYLFIFIYIFTHKTQRQALHNHSILVVLLLSFFIVIFGYSSSVNSSHYDGKVWPATPAFCQIWWLIDFGFFSSSTVILAWSSFERHIFIFHSNLLLTRHKRLLVHYFPLLFIIMYLTIFYIYAIFFPPCENEYDYTSVICAGEPCYYTVTSLVMWDTIVHGIIPTCLLVLFNTSLLWRVIWHRHSLHRRPDWKKYRKMTFELLAIVALYLFFNLPFMMIVFVQMIGYPDWGVVPERYFLFFSTLIQFILPFIFAAHLPGKWLFIKTIFSKRRRRVAPAIAVTAANRK